MLCIVIKRFYWGVKGKAKISTVIRFPMCLDLSSYVNGASLYSLKSVILHHGYSLHVGHYTSLVHNEMKGLRALRVLLFSLTTYLDQWFDCNDKTLEPIHEEDITSLEDNSPYILFYIKHSSA